MADKTWKRAERHVARLFGVERNPLSGADDFVSSSDSLHSRLYLETKYRKSFSLLTLWRSILPRAKKEGKIPCVCLKEKGKPGAWILVKIEDLKAVAKELL